MAVPPLSAVDWAALIEEQGVVEPDPGWLSRGVRDVPGEFVGEYLLGPTARVYRLHAAGVVWVGEGLYLLVVGVGLRWWWLTDGRTWWRWRHHIRPKATTDPDLLVKAGLEEALTPWGAEAVRQWVAVAVPSPVRPAVERTREAYALVVRARMRAVLVDLARLGIERTPEDLARAVSPTWTVADLEDPHPVTVQHAVAVSLVLALPADEGADLIEVAAWLALGGPWVDRTAATSIHAAARRQLAALVPEWWARGAALDWGRMGISVSGAFRAAHLRTLLAVEASGLPYGLAGALASARDLPSPEQGALAAQTAERVLTGALGDPETVRESTASVTG